MSIISKNDLNTVITKLNTDIDKSNLTNLRDCKVSTMENGKYIRIFYHNCTSGTTLFSSYQETLNCNTTNKFSRLYLLPFLNNNGTWEFILKYPTDYPNAFNHWTQTCNPISTYCQDSSFTNNQVTGYKAIKISWTANNWGGLALQNNPANTYMQSLSIDSPSSYNCTLSGSISIGNWYYAIGTTVKYVNGMPSFTVGTKDSVSTDVELWVRIDNVDIINQNYNYIFNSTNGTVNKEQVIDNLDISKLQYKINSLESIFSANCCQTFSCQVCQSNKCQSCQDACTCQSDKCQSCQNTCSCQSSYCQSCQRNCDCSLDD